MSRLLSHESLSLADQTSTSLVLDLILLDEHGFLGFHDAGAGASLLLPMIVNILRQSIEA
jgi:hypothetical protein